MNEYNLTDDQIIELEQIHRYLKDRRKADRVKAVIALAKGWSAADVAEILLIDEKTSRNYFQANVEKGVDELFAMKYQGSQPKFTEEQLLELEQHLDNFLYLDAKSAPPTCQKSLWSSLFSQWGNRSFASPWILLQETVPYTG